VPQIGLILNYIRKSDVAMRNGLFLQDSFHRRGLVEQTIELNGGEFDYLVAISIPRHD
jgi:hypothetical protein